MRAAGAAQASARPPDVTAFYLKQRIEMRADKGYYRFQDVCHEAGTIGDEPRDRQ
jgi:hypothetical protein